jgi:nicotinamidase-related amidase
MNSKALLVIDVQVAMFDEPVYQGEALLTKLAGLIAQARAANVPIIYVQHCTGPEGPLLVDTDGWQIHPAIAPQGEEPRIRKYHADSFFETNLQEELTRLGIKELIITGMQTEFCVDTTCRRAYSQGYDVTLVADAHSTFDSAILPAERIIAHHNYVLSDGFARVISADQVQL